MAMQLAGTRNNRMVHQNANAQARRDARGNSRSQKNGMKNGSINMNELNGNKDIILKRKQRAQARAMKVVSDAWLGDKKIQWVGRNRYDYGAQGKEDGPYGRIRRRRRQQ